MDADGILRAEEVEQIFSNGLDAKQGFAVDKLGSIAKPSIWRAAKELVSKQEPPMRCCNPVHSMTLNHFE